MSGESVLTADAALAHPGVFLRETWDDLRRAPSVGWRLFRSSVQARHRRTWLGYLWLLLPTLGTTLVWVYVQARHIVSTGPTALPYPIHVLAGTVLWQVFVDALNAPLQQFGAGRQMIARMRVPPEAFLFAGVVETLFNFAVRAVVIVPLLVYFGLSLRASAAFVPIGIVALTLFGLALGIAVTPLGLLYDDVGRAITLITGLWFFLTPVLYPANGAMRWNPLTPLIETTRGWMTGTTTAPGFAVVMALTVPAVAAMWLVLRVARPHVVARLG